MIPSWTVASVLAIALVSYPLDPNSVLIVVNTEAKEVETYGSGR